jgi:FKBP-type peptidyl-prolyl cis-trans isomerase FkpA
MAEVTRVPLQPIAKGSLLKLWLGVLVAVIVAAGIAWAAMPKGLSVDVVTAGEGPNPQMGDIAFIRYSGRLEDGTVFDQSEGGGWPIPDIMPDGAPMGLQEGALIDGFLQAILQMQKGGTYEVFIPAELAYGDEQREGSPIPPGSDLYFNVTLVDFLPEPEAQQRYMTMVQMMQQMQPAGAAPGAPGVPGPDAQPIPTE